MQKEMKPFEMLYEDKSMRLNCSLSGFISSFEFFHDYYGSEFDRGYLQLFSENSKKEKQYRLVLAYPGATTETAPFIFFYDLPNCQGIKGSIEIVIPYQCRNSLAKNLIVFAVTQAGVPCVTDMQRKEAEEYMEFLNNSYTGEEPSSALSIYHYRIFIYPDNIMKRHIIAVVDCNEAECGINSDINIEEYEDYTGSAVSSERYKDKKAHITGVVTENQRKMSNGILDVCSGGKYYRVIYDYVKFLDYLDCFEVNQECSFYGILLYNNKWHEDDKLRALLGYYDGHMRLDYVTRR